MRKFIYKLSGVESISKSFNPFYHLSIFFFKIFVKLKGLKIQAGLFKDLFLKHSRRGSEYMPKYLGTYERELYPFLSDYILNDKKKLIVDIGADDGYYTIGLAKCIKAGTILSFELDSFSCDVLRNNIKVNSDLLNPLIEIIVYNKKIENFDDLYTLIKPYETRTILIKADIEGGEYSLFTESFIRSLKQYNLLIIIETHFDPLAEKKIIDNFKSYDFDISIVDKTQKEVSDYDGDLNFLEKIILSLFWKRWTDEHRPRFNRWLIAKNKL